MSGLVRNLPWIVAALVVAAAVHVASVFALPHLIMARTMAGIARAAGGVNRIGHGQRPTAASRGVVRPSPDLLYSTCVYDLDAAHGALHVHAGGMPATYWSVSAFDADTDNFYVINDRKARGGGVDFLIIAPGAFIDGTKLPVVVAPTRKGIVLFRTLIDDEAHVADIDRARHGAACEPFTPVAG
jgi:uncharacterized membrane protein